ncbi:foldase protein PrsA [Paraliobacillus quinghaiensis]|uniref:Foldase protein PrsA n=1 Tax=Paraliobacillus quinghaiensis TaxID=470815 RepID=A0A917WSF1_9BACI|nr:peptidylprolyl isomerase [Paraliobacillus quinghaiensis]GGM25521.1 foldase protein PrsA [Paraliobacillus quinghaiensis]
MKKLAIAATLAAGIFTLSACSSDDPETVVETESGNITKEAFYNELKDTSGEAVLQQMVMLQILEDKYDLEEGEIDEQVEMYKSQVGDQWDAFLSQQGLADEEALREVLKINLLVQKAVTEDIEVTDEEIENRYERMQTEVEASHILVADEETAKDLKAQLDEGADFATLAKEHSIDGSATSGGELGYFSAGKMVAPFENAAFSLDVDEVSEPVESTHGWHIIKVTDKRELDTEVEPLEDIREDLRQEIALSKVENSSEKLDQVLEEANIDVKIEDFEDLFAKEEVAEDIVE